MGGYKNNLLTETTQSNLHNYNGPVTFKISCQNIKNSFIVTIKVQEAKSSKANVCSGPLNLRHKAHRTELTCFLSLQNPRKSRQCSVCLLLVIERPRRAGDLENCHVPFKVLSLCFDGCENLRVKALQQKLCLICCPETPSSSSHTTLVLAERSPLLRSSGCSYVLQAGLSASRSSLTSV